MRAPAWTKRGLRIACACGAVCALLAATALATARGGVTGIVTYVSDLETLSVSTEDGTVISCGVVTGTVKDASGLLTQFSAGGVLSPDGRLATDVQGRIDALRAVQASGGTLVATLAYDDAPATLCGSPQGNFVTSVTSAPAPSPTPRATATPAATASATPTPTPVPPTMATATPAPTPRTVSGRVTSVSPAQAFVTQGDKRCVVRQGTFKANTGETFRLTVMWPLVQSGPGSWSAADAHAVQRYEDLKRASALKATTTVTFSASTACGAAFKYVVSAVVVSSEPAQRGTRTGTVARLSSPSTITDRGSKCRIWSATLRPAFQVSVLSSRAASRLRAAGRARVRVTWSGPTMACGRVLSRVANTVKRR